MNGLKIFHVMSTKTTEIRRKRQMSNKTLRQLMEEIPRTDRYKNNGYNQIVDNINNFTGEKPQSILEQKVQRLFNREVFKEKEKNKDFLEYLDEISEPLGYKQDLHIGKNYMINISSVKDYLPKIDSISGGFNTAQFCGMHDGAALIRFPTLAFLYVKPSDVLNQV